MSRRLLRRWRRAPVLATCCDVAAYYNEHDPYAAQWLRNLIAAGHIAPGDVDERSITEVSADDLGSYTQCHFFAGIGVWSHALRRAGWDDTQPIWTGSCPCQPFSAAGERKGFDDERHLWPVWRSLIAQRRPPALLGEQVSSPGGLKWFDAIYTDLEDAGYAVAATDLCAASFGAAHIRQRLYWLASDTRNLGAPRPRYTESISQSRQRGPDCPLGMQQIINSPFVPGRGWPQPLLRKGVDEFTGWVGRIGAYGNALHAETATQFCGAVMEALQDVDDVADIL